jgi:hypothetical protein
VSIQKKIEPISTECQNALQRIATFIVCRRWAENRNHSPDALFSLLPLPAIDGTDLVSKDLFFLRGTSTTVLFAEELKQAGYKAYPPTGGQPNFNRQQFRRRKILDIDTATFSIYSLEVIIPSLPVFRDEQRLSDSRRLGRGEAILQPQLWVGAER